MTASIAALIPGLPFAPPHPAPIVRSAQDLCSALRSAQSRQPAPDLSRLDRVLRMDTRNGLVEVQAGVHWRALGEYLSAQAVTGWQSVETAAARAGLPATLAECVARNPAGPDGTAFIAHVEALAVVTADGELRRTSRSLQPELFRLVNGGHGALAAVYSVTLRFESLGQCFAQAADPVCLAEGDNAAVCLGNAMRLMVPPARLPAFLDDLRQAFDDYRLPLDGLRVRRTRPENETFLRWADREFALVEVPIPRRGTLPAQVALTQIRRRLIASALAQGGRFDLASGHDASREQVEAAYPMFSAFLAEKRRHDPQERFGGAWHQHYSSLFRREPCEVRWSNA